MAEFEYIELVLIYTICFYFKPTFPKALDVTSSIKSTVKQQTRTNSTLKKNGCAFRFKNCFRIRCGGNKDSRTTVFDQFFQIFQFAIKVLIRIN